MWSDEELAAAPSIVISSLGGLVYGKGSLTARDISRARMLRQVLKTPLGRPRGPPPKGQAYAPSLVDPDHDFASEVIQHRVLPVDGVTRLSHEVNTASNHRPLVRNGTESSIMASTPRTQRGWRAQGSLAGEWRDRLGRHRRANPSNNNTARRAGRRPSALPWARTEVSFDGLVEELRERLPQASPLLAEEELLAAACTTRNSSDSKKCRTAGGEGEASTVEMTATLAPVATALGVGENDEEAGASRQQQHNKEHHSSRRAAICSNQGLEAGEEESGESRGRSSSALPGHDATRRTTSNITDRGRSLPPGCHPLRRSIGAARAPSANKQVPWSGFGNTFVARDQLGPEQPRLPVQSQGVFVYDSAVASTGGRLGLRGASTTLDEDVSPSATMVAAARAQERALPLLQVCAMRVTEPPTAARV